MPLVIDGTVRCVDAITDADIGPYRESQFELCEKTFPQARAAQAHDLP